jgi:transcriptional regulator with XRE-family HTH domain
MKGALQAHTFLADHLKSVRTSRGFSLQDLSAKSGVSRATLSRIENAEVSPTAETSAFSLPLSQLLAPLEPGFPPVVRRENQSLWTDPSNGFIRRAVSPPSGQLKLEMIEAEIEPRQRITYDRPSISGHEHHLLLLAGALALTVDGVRHELRPGDCLRYRLQGASIFETSDHPARYIIAMA